jgi:hypothetical protein
MKVRKELAQGAVEAGDGKRVLLRLNRSDSRRRPSENS